MGICLSTVSLDTASQADVSQHKAEAIKQQQQHHTPLTAYAADSASSISGSHMEAEYKLEQRPAGRKLFATVRDSLLFKKPWLHFGASLVISGIQTYTAEQQAAVQAAYDEVVAGSQQRFEDLYQMGHMLGSGHYARYAAYGWSCGQANGTWHMTLHVLAILAATLLSMSLPASTLTAPTRVSTHQGTQ
jgi:hypothetical protein